MAVDGKTTILSLQTIKGVRVAKDIDYWGHYPVAALEFDIDSPIGVGLRAWAPFLPGDAATSNTPGAVFEVRLRNASDKPHQVSLAFSFHGPRQIELEIPNPPYPPSVPPQYQRQLEQGEFSGVAVRTVREGKVKDYEYGYALGVVDVDRVRVGGSLDADANAWNNMAEALPEPSSAQGGSSVAVDFLLPPGASKTVRFVLAWYAPFWPVESNFALRPPPAGMEDTIYAHMYHTRFDSALEVAQLLAREYASLLKRVLAWQQVIYAEEKLPGWLQDSLVNVLALIPQNSFWAKSSESDHWWGDEGIFNVNESLISCPQSGCLGNDWIGQWPIDLMFPDLSRNYLRVRKHYQDDDGAVPFAIGGFMRLEQPYQVFQIPMNNQYYLHMLDRLWQNTGDDAVLREFYPSIKAAVNFLMSLDKDGDGLVEMAGTYSQYHEGIPESAAVVNSAGYWLATLAISERMAKKMTDQAFATECRAWYDQGKRTLEDMLWNEEVGSYFLFNPSTGDENSETVLADQLTGEWSACVHGLPGIFSPERVKKVLATLERLNVAATPVGIKVAVHPHGGTPRGFSPVVPSYSTLIPSSLMLYSGDDHFRKLGLEIVWRTWHNMVMNQQMTWDMPCTVNVDGTATYGLEYYHNTMLWSFLIPVLDQDIQTISAPGGFVHRIIQASKE